MDRGSGPFKEQLRRLCGATYHIYEKNQHSESDSTLLVAEKWMRSEDGVHVTLSPGFFMMTGDSIVPLESDGSSTSSADLRSLLDLYAWLSYRLFKLKKETTIGWLDLERQFGSHYKRPRAFRSKFQMSLEKVLKHTPPAPVVEVREKGLHLSPGPPSDVEWMERMIARARSSTRFPILV